MMDNALAYAESGLAVFPLVPKDKKPMTRHGFSDASTAPRQIREWWTNCPQANIGIACGAMSGGLLVIDLDVHDDIDGCDFLNEFELTDPLPDTMTTRTGSGGMHILYRADREIRPSVNTAIGVDIRCDGSYIVAPPSVHPNGNLYTVVDDRPIAQADDAVYRFVEAARPAGADRERTHDLNQSPSELGEGSGRNNWLYGQGASLRGRGFGDEAIRSCLEVMNREMREPLGKRELAKIVHSVCSLPVGMSDEAKKSKKETKQTGGKFQHNEIAKRLIDERGACLVDGMPAIRGEDGSWLVGWDAYNEAIIEMHDSCTKKNRNETIAYILAKAPRKAQAPARYIAFSNGILDIETMQLEAADDDPELVILNTIPHRWNPDAQSAIVDETLMKMACQDMAIYTSLIETIGMCMYRSAEFTQSAILLGEGANGKSTYIRMLQLLLGRDNYSSLSLNQLGKQFYTKTLAGKLANLGDDISNEFAQSSTLETFKKLVDGNRMYCDVKNSEGFTFSSYATLVYSANEFPRLADVTEGMMRRLFPIEFNAVFRKSDPDYNPRIVHQLGSESACERLAVVGINGLASVFASNGFTPNEHATRQLAQIRLDNNTVLGWLEWHRYCRDDIVGRSIHEAYSSYRDWCLDSGVGCVSRAKFTRRVNGLMSVQSGTRKEMGTAVRAFV